MRPCQRSTISLLVLFAFATGDLAAAEQEPVDSAKAAADAWEALVDQAKPRTKTKTKTLKDKLDFWLLYQLSGVPHLTPGVSAELTITGKRLQISAVELDPPTGVTIQAVTETEPQSWEKGLAIRRWTFEIVVDKAAPLGERHLTIVAPGGHYKPKKVRIVDHVPRLSHLRVLTVSPKLQIQAEWKAFDDAGDIAKGSEPTAIVRLFCSDIPNSLNATGLVTTSLLSLEDPKTSQLSATFYPPFPVTVGPEFQCNLFVGIMEKTGIESGAISTPISLRARR